MTTEKDSLQLLPFVKWPSLQELFRVDFPRGITGFNALETQRRWKQDGVNFVFDVFCPYGDLQSGMVAILCETDAYYEILIECPRDDTTKLEDALRKTKVINWKRDIVVLFMADHVIECLKKVADDVNVSIEHISPLQLYILDKSSPLFDVSLPPEVIFKPLTPEHVDLVNSKWPHRYPGSTDYFNLLIQAKSGYGLFKDDQLIAWAFIKELGALGNIYTLEEQRRNGYGEEITKVVCNVLLKEDRYVNSYCLERNVGSCKMHEKLGFDRHSGVASCHLKWKLSG